jgi:hypothetical protein
MVWGELVNNLVEKVNGGDWHLILAPILELDEGKSAVFGMLDIKHDYRLSAVVCELRGGVGGGVAHAQSVAEKRFRRKNFLRVFAIILFFILLDMMWPKASNRFFFTCVSHSVSMSYGGGAGASA